MADFDKSPHRTMKGLLSGAYPARTPERKKKVEGLLKILRERDATDKKIPVSEFQRKKLIPDKR